MRVCAGVFSGGGPIPSVLRPGGGTVYPSAIRAVCSQPPQQPLSLHQGKRVRVPTGLPGSADCLWAPGVDCALIIQGLEPSGNHKLALASWALPPPS